MNHPTLASVISEIESSIISKGYALPECFNELTYWTHINYGDTFRDNIQLTFDAGKKHNDGIAFQIYRTSNGMYELNKYYWR